ncbi:SNF2-related protein [Actinoplanes sp. NPDC020271]|uniref:SNF2-related protein n=1 Tax=Actinoplanes sp. NPDC020271 TaxID=3363896 RepID=UPI0037AADC98
MGELVSIERVITDALLEHGEIILSTAELHRLGFGEHSAEVTLVAAGEQVPALWTAGRRQLSGEALAEYLQDTARVGGLLRLEKRGAAVVELVLLPPAARLEVVSPALSPPVAPMPAGAGAAAESRTRRRISTGARYRLRQRDEYTWREGVGFLDTARENLRTALENGGWDPADAVRTRLEGERLATLDQFDELLAVDAAKIEHMAHQEAAARTVLTRMGGRGVLADEVGLGKTVEAGLVLKELVLRGLARRIVIICPAPLREQWRQELREKFDEDFQVVTTGRDPQAFQADRLIITLELAIRNEQHLQDAFDLVIVDEAHRLSGSASHARRAVVERLIAKSPRVLFLSATPVQNNLLELYRLVELLRPGTFDSQAAFERRFVDQSDPRRPVNAPELRRLISSVVVRTTREQAGVDRVHRMPPLDRGVELTAPERQLYNLIVDTLRHRMTGPGDSMRRKALALRLTASPQAVSKSALRMAGKEPDGDLRRVLTDIGHLAGDIRHTSREQAALSILRDWIGEHGRVLLFTQHTDTLQGLLKLLVVEGIPAAAFHGGMTSAARTAAVERFKSGAAPVLLSTDAGAEGQNLQVSNCVLNYDLPWNPMRVEQRIGRVHRITQTRNVHIANLFARDTLDENVYRLLHDKLAMFELLFGQVVTVLGELGGAQDTSMEARVLEALYANSDHTMQRRLDELGNDLADARTRAGKMMTADSGLSAWLAQRQQERAHRAAQPQARDLLPQTAEKPRRRQKDLEHFVRGFLAAAGAEVSSPAEDLVAAALPADLAAEFGRDQLYLAFTGAALEHHPDAEFCVVGSDVFDDILAVQRQRGDLTGSMPEPTSQDPVLPHDPRVRLAWRRIEHDESWSARATYRVQEDTASGNQELVTVEVGSLPTGDDGRLPLADEAPIPGDQEPATILARVEDAAVSQLGKQLLQTREAEREQRSKAQEALVHYLESQLAEADRIWKSKRTASALDNVNRRMEQLQRAVETSREPAERGAETELRAELLALEVHGPRQVAVVERWERTDGVAREIRYPWSADLRPACEVTGEPITTLSMCGSGHLIDETALHSCEICRSEGCGRCEPDRVVSDCAGCGRAVCGTCRMSGVFCGDCRYPVRDSSIDTRWELGWRLGADAYLLVGERHTTHVSRDGQRRVLVPAADVEDQTRSRVRGMATRLGLPPSTGLVSAGSTVDAEASVAGALWSEIEYSTWWDARMDAGADIDGAAAFVLPDLTGPDVTAESVFAALLADLRQEQSPPVAPSLAAVPFTITRRIDLRGPELIYQELWQDADREPMTAVRITGPLVTGTHIAPPPVRAIASAQAGEAELLVEGLHRSYLYRLTIGDNAVIGFVPGLAGATFGAESRLARQVADAGLTPDWVRARPSPQPEPTGLTFSVPATGTEVSRTVTTWRLPVEGAGSGPELEAPKWARALEHHRDVVTRDDEPTRMTFAALDRPLRQVADEELISVEETWTSGKGQAVRRYLIGAGTPLRADVLNGRTLLAPGQPLVVRLEDGTVAADDITVDRHGHLITAAEAITCRVCGDSYGACCGALVGVCAGCDQPACESCRSADVCHACTAIAQRGTDVERAAVVVHVSTRESHQMQPSTVAETAAVAEAARMAEALQMAEIARRVEADQAAHTLRQAEEKRLAEANAAAEALRVAQAQRLAEAHRAAEAEQQLAVLRAAEVQRMTWQQYPAPQPASQPMAAPFTGRLKGPKRHHPLVHFLLIYTYGIGNIIYARRIARWNRENGPFARELTHWKANAVTMHLLLICTYGVGNIIYAWYVARWNRAQWRYSRQPWRANSIGVHVLLSLCTFGLGNTLYAWYIDSWNRRRGYR